MRETFRILIVASTGLYLVWFFYPLLGWYFLSEDTLNVLSWGGYGAQVNLPLFTHYLILALWILAAVGMYFFIPVARSLFVWMYILFTGLGLFQGVVVYSSVEAAMYTLFTLMDGAIIAMAYLTSIERIFAVGESPEQQP